MSRSQSQSLAYLIVHRAYTIAITPSRNRYIRSICLTSVVIIFILRAYKLWLRPTLFIAAPSLAVATAGVGLPSALFLFFALPYLAILYLVHIHPDDGIGHRVGFEGYTGTQIENTVPALHALAAADAAGDYDDDRKVVFPFIEFDVRETKDGELVLFHDLGLKLAFPTDFENGGGENQFDSTSNSILNINAKPLRVLAEQGIDWKTASVEDLTLKQLQTLYLGGRQGCHVPTLKEFLEACIACGVRRSLAVEIKAIRTDAARHACLNLLTWYLETYGKKLDSDPVACKLQYKPLGWAGIIAFPHLFCESFGEFGSPEWRRWAKEMKKREISARCVHFHYLDFTLGA